MGLATTYITCCNLCPTSSWFHWSFLGRYPYYPSEACVVGLTSSGLVSSQFGWGYTFTADASIQLASGVGVLILFTIVTGLALALPTSVSNMLLMCSRFLLSSLLPSPSGVRPFTVPLGQSGFRCWHRSREKFLLVLPRCLWVVEPRFHWWFLLVAISSRHSGCFVECSRCSSLH